MDRPQKYDQREICMKKRKQENIPKLNKHYSVTLSYYI